MKVLLFVTFLAIVTVACGDDTGGGTGTQTGDEIASFDGLSVRLPISLQVHVKTNQASLRAVYDPAAQLPMKSDAWLMLASQASLVLVKERIDTLRQAFLDGNPPEGEVIDLNPGGTRQLLRWTREDGLFRVWYSYMDNFRTYFEALKLGEGRFTCRVIGFERAATSEPWTADYYAYDAATRQFRRLFVSVSGGYYFALDDLSETAGTKVRGFLLSMDGTATNTAGYFWGDDAGGGLLTAGGGELRGEFYGGNGDLIREVSGTGTVFPWLDGYVDDNTLNLTGFGYGSPPSSVHVKYDTGSWSVTNTAGGWSATGITVDRVVYKAGSAWASGDVVYFLTNVADQGGVPVFTYAQGLVVPVSESSLGAEYYIQNNWPLRYLEPAEGAQICYGRLSATGDDSLTNTVWWLDLASDGDFDQEWRSVGTGNDLPLPVHVWYGRLFDPDSTESDQYGLLPPADSRRIPYLAASTLPPGLTCQAAAGSQVDRVRAEIEALAATGWQVDFSFTNAFSAVTMEDFP